MPEISRFYGVSILMFIDDHKPPHIHVRYAGYRTTITIDNYIVEGRIPGRVLNMVFQWMDEHKEELIENWNRLKNSKDPNPVAPFEK